MEWLAEKIYDKHTGMGRNSVIFSNEMGDFPLWEIYSRVSWIRKWLAKKRQKYGKNYVWISLWNGPMLLSATIACLFEWCIPLYFPEDASFESTELEWLIWLICEKSGTQCNILNVHSVFSDSETAPVSPRGKDTDESCVILTSGTTSWIPKKVILTEKNIGWAIERYRDLYNISESTAIGSSLPPHYSFPIVAGMLPALVNGARFVALNDHSDYVRLLYHLKRCQVNVLLWNPHTLADVARNFDEKLPDLRLCDSGGSPLSKSIRNLFRRRFWILISEGYWPTETSTLTHFRKNYDDASFPNFVWRKVEGVNTRILPVVLWIGNLWILHISWDMVTPWYIWKPHAFVKFSTSDPFAEKVDWFNTWDVVIERNDSLFFIWRYSDVKWMGYSDLMKLVHLREMAYQLDWVREMTFIHGSNGEFYCFVWTGWATWPNLQQELFQIIGKMRFSKKTNLSLLEHIPKNINWKYHLHWLV